MNRLQKNIYTVKIRTGKCMSRFFVVGKYGGDGGGGARCNMNGFKFNLSTYLIYQTALVEIHQIYIYFTLRNIASR